MVYSARSILKNIHSTFIYITELPCAKGVYNDDVALQDLIKSNKLSAASETGTHNHFFLKRNLTEV